MSDFNKIIKIFLNHYTKNESHVILWIKSCRKKDGWNCMNLNIFYLQSSCLFVFVFLSMIFYKKRAKNLCKKASWQAPRRLGTRPLQNTVLKKCENTDFVRKISPSIRGAHITFEKYALHRITKHERKRKEIFKSKN